MTENDSQPVSPADSPQPSSSVGARFARVLGRLRSIQRIKGILVDAWYPLMMFAVSRAGLMLLSYLTLGTHRISPGLRRFPNNLFLDGFARWDSGWYGGMVDQGYIAPTAIAAGVQRNTALFPFYPIVVRAMKLLVGDTWLAGLLVSNIAFLAATVMLHKLVAKRLGDECARRAVVLACVAPFSVFFMAVYSESLFFALAIGAFLAAERRHWLWAGILAALAGATRVNGFLIVPALALLYLEQIEFKLGRIRWDVVFVAIGLLGPVAHLTFLWLRYGSPLEFWNAQYVHGWAKEVPLSAALNELAMGIKPSMLAIGRGASLTFVQLLSPAFLIVLVAWGLWKKKIAWSYAMWSVLMTASAFSKWTSAGRYVSVVFPMYILMAIVGERPTLYHGLLALSCVLAAHQQVLFALWRWVA
jgi:hypothetical protein